MITKIEKVFRSPYAVPNGLQVTDDGLWIVDQITDRVALVEITSDPDYTVPKLIRDIPSESSNTSGMTYRRRRTLVSRKRIWGTLAYRIRDTDAETGEIFQVDPATGETLGRYPIPDGGGTHGVEYDHYDEGHLWVQTLKDQVTHKVRISDWSVQKTLPLPHGRGHGMVRVEDGLWSTHTSDRVIVKLDLEDGTPLDHD